MAPARLTALAAQVASAPRIALAALAALFLAAGCDPELNEIEVGPRLPVATAYDGGSWEMLGVLNCGRGLSCFAFWSPERGLVGGRSGVILRWQDGRVWNQDLPLRSSVIGLATQRPGIAYALLANNAVFRLDGTGWTRDRLADNGWQLRRIWCDQDGVVTIAGDHGRICGRNGGVWSTVSLGLEEDLVDIWGPGDGELWLIGKAGALVHHEDGQWLVEWPFAADEKLVDVSGDQSGDAVVVGQLPSGQTNRCRVHWRQDGVWRDLPPLHDNVYSAILLAGRPLLFGPTSFYWWDGAQWVRQWMSDDGPRYIRDAVVAGDMALGLDDDDNLIRWSGGEGEVFVANLGVLHDAVVAGADTLVLTSNGSVLRHGPLGWTTERRFGQEWSIERSMRLDASGAPCVNDGDQLYRRVDGAWMALDLPFTAHQLHDLADNTLVLTNVETGEAWLHGAGGLRCIGFADQEAGRGWLDLMDVAGQSAAGFWLLDYGLSYYDGLTFQRWPTSWTSGVDRLAWAPDDGLLLYGSRGLFALTNAGTEQLTPRRDWLLDEDSYGFRHVLALPSGEWLAWVQPGMLMRRAHGEWQYLRGAGFSVVTDHMSAYPWDTIWGDQRIRLVAREAGAVMCVTGEALLLYRDPTYSPAVAGPAASPRPREVPAGTAAPGEHAGTRAQEAGG